MYWTATDHINSCKIFSLKLKCPKTYNYISRLSRFLANKALNQHYSCLESHVRALTFDFKGNHFTTQTYIIYIKGVRIAEEQQTIKPRDQTVWKDSEGKVLISHARTEQMWTWSKLSFSAESEPGTSSLSGRRPRSKRQRCWHGFCSPPVPSQKDSTLEMGTRRNSAKTIFTWFSGNGMRQGICSKYLVHAVKNKKKRKKNGCIKVLYWNNTAQPNNPVTTAKLL